MTRLETYLAGVRKRIKDIGAGTANLLEAQSYLGKAKSYIQNSQSTQPDGLGKFQKRLSGLNTQLERSIYAEARRLQTVAQRTPADPLPLGSGPFPVSSPSPGNQTLAKALPLAAWGFLAFAVFLFLRRGK
jgi:hypothetical protein